MNSSLQQEARPVAPIKVVGIGGAGENIVNRMASMGIGDVDFMIMNTDMRQGRPSPVRKILLGATLPGASGTSGSIELGRQSAEASRDVITEALRGARMVLLIAGMGGGTGTGAAPVMAQIAKAMGISTACVVTEPFPYEDKKRREQAEQGIDLLRTVSGEVLTFPNGRPSANSDPAAPFSTVIEAVDIMVCQAAQRLVGRVNDARSSGAGQDESPQPDACTGNEMDDLCKIGHHAWELWVCKVCGAVRR